MKIACFYDFLLLFVYILNMFKILTARLLYDVIRKRMILILIQISSSECAIPICTLWVGNALSLSLSLCPQGSKIDPITFIGMIDSAAADTKTHTFKYVNDLSLQEVLPARQRKEIFLKLDPSKCKVMQVCFMKDPPSPQFLRLMATSLGWWRRLNFWAWLICSSMVEYATAYGRRLYGWRLHNKKLGRGDNQPTPSVDVLLKMTQVDEG